MFTKGVIVKLAVCFTRALLPALVFSLACGREPSPRQAPGDSSNGTSPAATDSQAAPALAHRVLRDRSSETAGSAKVLWEVLVLPGAQLTRANLSALLADLDRQARQRRFRRHAEPTLVDIKVFASEAHAQSGMGQWVAWLSRTPDNPGPTIRFDERQLGSGKPPDPITAALPEDKRRAVWAALVRAEDRARREAERMYPERVGPNRAQNLAYFQRRAAASDSLRKRYLAAVARKHGVSRPQLEAILREGEENSWPLPR